MDSISSIILPFQSHSDIIDIVSKCHVPIAVSVSSTIPREKRRNLLSNFSIPYNDSSYNISMNPVSRMDNGDNGAMFEVYEEVEDTTGSVIECESWVCKPWPIYIAFFAGIGVTVLVTMAISLTTGEKDTELNTALEKVITAGIWC